MVNLYSKVDCYLCEEKILGRDIGSEIGCGKFLHYICKDCTKKNYIWATSDELITEFEKEQKKLQLKINKLMLELGGIIEV